MNVVLISIDCARPDYLNHGFFDKIKSEGIEYKNCIAQAPFTGPSHASIFTGVYPFRHNVRWLVDFNVKAKMMQEILKGEGYNTAAFIGGYPLPTGDLNRGFDLFEHRGVVTDLMEGRQKYDPVNVLTMRAMEWLANNSNSNNFVFLHLFDLHFTLRSEFGKGPFPETDENGLYENVEDFLGRTKRRYEEEMSFVASQIQLLQELSDIDLLIITADHGTKMIGDKNYPWVYNSDGQKAGSQFRAVELWDTLLKVPLLLWGKDIEHKTVDNLVRSVDIMPTVLSLLGMDCPPSLDGVDLLNEAPPEYAYSETYHGQLVESNRLTYEMNKKYGWGWSMLDSLVSLRSNKHKLICTANDDIKPYKFYNLAEDSHEENNLLKKDFNIQSEYGEEFSKMMEELMNLLAEDNQMKVLMDKIDQETIENLKQLGYM